MTQLRKGKYPSGGLMFGAGQGRLDRVLDSRAGGRGENAGEGVAWGRVGGRVQAYPLRKFILFFIR